MSQELALSAQQIWQDDEHLSDVALSVLADGQLELLPAAARAHADSCDQCAERLGNQALLSLSVHEALTEERAPEVALEVAASRPLPVGALLLGLAIAVLGAVPTLLAAPTWVADLPATLTRALPVALRVAVSLLKVASTGGSSMLVVWTVAAVFLGLIGVLVARLAPREAAWKGVSK